MKVDELCSGYPKGRIVEIYGPESSGKTTMAIHAIAEVIQTWLKKCSFPHLQKELKAEVAVQQVQAKGGTAALIDAEHAFDPQYAASLGVKSEDLIICQPENGEMALEVADQLARSNAVDLIAVDSVAALVPKAEIEGEIGLVQVSRPLSDVGSAEMRCATR